jgi:chorismate mutase
MVEDFNSIDIKELRIKIDQLNEKIISGLKTRTRYSLNKSIFEREFFDGLTWFEYRLKKEQDLDSEFGRFLYYDQQPFRFSKNELEQSKIKNIINKGSKPIEIDLSKKIIELYRNTLKKICENIEDESTFGETTKLDVENILTLNERTVGIGEQVAAYKIHSDPILSKINDAVELRKKLVKPEREKEVIEKTTKIAEKYGFDNVDFVKNFAKNIIDITLDAEVHFILNSK